MRLRVCFSVLLAVLFILSGCREPQKTEAEDPAESLAPTENNASDKSNEINPIDTNKYIIQTPFYQIYEDDVQVYKYRIESGNHILVEDVKTGTSPQIEDKGEGILKLHLGSGTNAFTVKYFDVYNKTVSEEFHPYSIYADYIDTATKDYFIAYFKPEEKPKLYINGFFDSSDFSNQLDLNFAIPTCEKLIFLNETEIYVEYIDSNSERMKQVVNFRNPAENTASNKNER